MLLSVFTLLSVYRPLTPQRGVWVETHSKLQLWRKPLPSSHLSPRKMKHLGNHTENRIDL